MAHTTQQPGLHAHSINPDRNKLRRYQVAEQTPSGRLVLESFDTLDEAQIRANADDLYTKHVLILDDYRRYIDHDNYVVEVFEPGVID